MFMDRADFLPGYRAGERKPRLGTLDLVQRAIEDGLAVSSVRPGPSTAYAERAVGGGPWCCVIAYCDASPTDCATSCGRTGMWHANGLHRVSILTWQRPVRALASSNADSTDGVGEPSLAHA
jgi:hypothetical protein